MRRLACPHLAGLSSGKLVVSLPAVSGSFLHVRQFRLVLLLLLLLLQCIQVKEVPTVDQKQERGCLTSWIPGCLLVLGPHWRGRPSVLAV